MKNTYATKEHRKLIFFCSIKYDIGNVLSFFTFLILDCAKHKACKKMIIFLQASVEVALCPICLHVLIYQTVSQIQFGVHTAAVP